MTNTEKQKILTFFDTQHICSLSTTNTAGTSESAAMAFSNFEDLTIIFQTPNTTRKYQNLTANPHVSIVVGFDLATMQTLQYEGIAEEVTDPMLIDKVRQNHIRKNTASQEYAYLEANKYFLVTPTWLRYSDLSKTNYEVFEYAL